MTLVKLVSAAYVAPVVDAHDSDGEDDGDPRVNDRIGIDLHRPNLKLVFSDFRTLQNGCNCLCNYIIA